ncbi:methyltransferase [Streptomyces liangshanensis]|uniref:methyltransferase n=1 Tax=Streptomyces liangshanensis TaxID=2717324 RepID=UPI0036D99632
MEQLMPGTVAHPSDFGAMWDMVTAYRASQLARVAAVLSLPEHLAEGEKTAEEIARAESTDPDATFRLLRMCASFGLVSAREGGRFAGTGLLATLRADAPGSMRGLALTLSAPGHWLTWGRLPEAVISGGPQAVQALGRDLWDHYAEQPAEAADFALAMSGMTAAVGDEAARLIDTTGVERAVDVGGGNGSLVHALMAAHPDLSGVVLDLPSQVEQARARIGELGLQDRLTAETGDFFEAVPEGDLLLLRYILHDWDDESARRILTRCREALRPGGRLLVMELTVGELGGPSIGPSQDLNMMVLFGGRERTSDEYGALFASVGLKLVSSTHTNSPMTILEAVVAD